MPQEAALDYYLNSIKDVFEQCGPADSIAAIVVEPLQGEGGFIPAPIEWVKAVRKICDENGILLVADEVQTGFCRTGRMFATQYWEEAGVQPDILATAKSIAAGFHYQRSLQEKKSWKLQHQERSVVHSVVTH